MSLSDVPNDVVRMLMSHLDNSSLLAFRLALGRRSAALDDAIFALLLRRATVLHALSAKAVADVLTKTFKKPLFLTRSSSQVQLMPAKTLRLSSSVQLVPCESQHKSEYLTRRVHAKAFRGTNFSRRFLCNAGTFLSETCHFRSDDSVFFSGKGLMSSEGVCKGSVSSVTYSLPFVSDTALFVSCSLPVESTDQVKREGEMFCFVYVVFVQVVVGSNTGELALLDVSRGSAPRLVEQWEVEAVTTCSLGCSREVVALQKAKNDHVLVVAAAHWIERRDLEAGKSVGSLLQANSIRSPGGESFCFFFVVPCCQIVFLFKKKKGSELLGEILWESFKTVFWPTPM
jgi:hypothetical protein